MTDDNTYTIRKEIDQDNISSFYRLKSGGTKKVEVEMQLTEEEVRKLASHLPEETEQQKVSDCCGGEVYATSSVWGEKREKIYCKSCGEPCDAVKPDDKIEKLRKEILRGSWDVQQNRNKINEIIEKINNE